MAGLIKDSPSPGHVQHDHGSQVEGAKQLFIDSKYWYTANQCPYYCVPSAPPISSPFRPGVRIHLIRFTFCFSNLHTSQ